MKRIISVITVLFLLCMNICSAEAPLVQIDYNRQTGMVQISGTVTASTSKVMLTVLRPGATVSDLDAAAGDFFASAIHADEATVTEQAYIFDSFNISPYQAGTYTVRVSDGKEVTPKQIHAATPDQAFMLMKNAQTAAEVLEYVELYNDVYGLDTGADSLFQTIGDAGKQETAVRIAAGNPSTQAELKEQFDRNNILYKIHLGPWTAIGQLLNDNSAILGIDITALSGAYNASDVYKALVGNLFTGTTDLNTAYLTAISQSRAPQIGIVGGAVSSGGGGGGSAYIQPVIPSTDHQETENINPADSTSFSDVGQTHWAANSIEKLYSKAIINGKGENRFAPNDKVTRAEAIKMIVLTFGLEDTQAEVTFSDVTESDWAYRYICSGVSNNIVNGYSDVLFGKDDDVTRQDLAVMIYRAAKMKNLLTSSGETMNFSDDDSISQYAKKAVGALSEEKIINGYNGLFMPLSNATRAETAKMLAAFLDEI